MGQDKRYRMDLTKVRERRRSPKKRAVSTVMAELSIRTIKIRKNK